MHYIYISYVCVLNEVSRFFSSLQREACNERYPRWNKHSGRVDPSVVKTMSNPDKSIEHRNASSIHKHTAIVQHMRWSILSKKKTWNLSRHATKKQTSTQMCQIHNITITHALRNNKTPTQRKTNLNNQFFWCALWHPTIFDSVFGIDVLAARPTGGC